MMYARLKRVKQIAPFKFKCIQIFHSLMQDIPIDNTSRITIITHSDPHAHRIQVSLR